VNDYRKELDRMRLLTEQLQRRVVVAEETARSNAGRSSTENGPPRGHGESDPSRPFGPGGQFFGARGRGPRESPGRGRWTRGRPTRGTCHNCGQEGHWWRECPTRQDEEALKDDGNAVPIGLVARNEAETYIEAEVNGNKVDFLLDTGCCLNILPVRMVDKNQLQSDNTELFAVNHSPVDVVGSTTWDLRFGRHKLEVKFLVSSTIDEAILGISFLKQHVSTWSFDKDNIQIADETFPLHERKAQRLLRRIYVSEPVVVPPASEMNVPVHLRWASWATPVSDWLIEPKKVSDGVYMARTLLNDESEYPAVRVVNVNARECQLKDGTYLGNAEYIGPADICGVQDEAQGQPKGPREPDDCARPNSEGDKLSDAAHQNDDFKHVQSVIDTIPDSLSEQQKELAANVIKKNADVFSRSKYDLGRTKLIQHRIDIGQNRPFKEPLRRHPKAYLDIIDEQVDLMLKHDIIEPACSPFASNVVLVLKKGERDSDGRETRPVRFCNDYRRLNAMTYKDSFPLPRIDSCLDMLAGSKYFATLDMSCSFWQTEVHPEDRDKTAFITRKGQFRYKVLSFGLANSPSSFQRLIDLVLAGLVWKTCLVYIDDIILMSETVEQMVERLDEIFGRLRNANLKLKPSKCKVFQTDVIFLGHRVGPDGKLGPDPEKVRAVQEWHVPTNVTEVRAFVALAAYYRKFQAHFSDIAAPLYELTRKGEKFEWTERRQQAFEQLKQALVSAPVLALPRDEGDWLVDVDCSDWASGGILQQRQDGEWRVIAYSSRLLSKAEQKYCTTRKELLAIVHALKTWKTYLLGRKLTLRTDHSALLYLRKSPELIGQQARWLDFLESFDIALQFRPGKSHSNADSLSRRPCEKDGPCRQCKTKNWMPSDSAERSADLSDSDIKLPVQAVATRARKQAEQQAGLRAQQQQPQQQHTDETHEAVGVSADGSPAQPPVQQDAETRQTDKKTSDDIDSNENVMQGPVADADSDSARCGWTAKELADLQASDTDISPVLQCLISGNKKPSLQAVKPYSTETKAYFAQFDTLELKNGVVYRKFYGKDGQVELYQLLAPRKIRAKIIQNVHSNLTGHFNAKKTQKQIQQRCYWYNWKKDVEIFCRCCEPCNKFHRGVTPKHGKLQDMRVGAPFERLQVDLTGPFPRSEKTNLAYICTCICAFTKFVIAVPIPDKSAITVAQAIIEHVILKHGSPDVILSDLGREWENSLFRELCRGLGIQKDHTTAFHSRGNGAVERFHRSLHSMLAKVVKSHQLDWPDHVPYIVNAYNSTVHASTGYSPYFLLYGREQRAPLDVVLGSPRVDRKPVSEYARILLDRLHGAHTLVRENLHKYGEAMKRRYDLKVKEREYRPGEKVWVLNPRIFKGRSPKWEKRYQGPFEVVERLNDVNYKVRRKAGDKIFVTHADKLKPVISACQCYVMLPGMYQCPLCAYQGGSTRSMKRHCLGHHAIEWRGPGLPTRDITPDRAEEARTRLRKLQMNSRQRRREFERTKTHVDQADTTSSGADPPRGSCHSSRKASVRGNWGSASGFASAAVGAPAVSDVSDPMWSPAVLQTEGASPAHEGLAPELEACEMPELYHDDEYLRDIDISPSSWLSDGSEESAAAVEPETQAGAATASPPSAEIRDGPTNTGMTAARPPPQAVPLFRVYRVPTPPPTAPSPPPQPTTRDVATDVDPCIRLGRPGGIDPTSLAELVLASPAVPAEILAATLTPRPVDQEEARAIRLAVDSAIATETNILRQIAIAVNGHLAMGSPQAAYDWLRGFTALHSCRPQPR